jgi:hypothetical protein
VSHVTYLVFNAFVCGSSKKVRYIAGALQRCSGATESNRTIGDRCEPSPLPKLGAGQNTLPSLTQRAVE